MSDWSFHLRYGGREIPLAEGDTVIGRSRGSGVRIDEDSVSRSHALLSLRGSVAQIRDLGSSNGLFVNGKRVTKETVLKNGDSIGLGSVVVSFAAAAPPEVEAKTAMINISGRPSQSVTQFIRTEVEPAAPSDSAKALRRDGESDSAKPLRRDGEIPPRPRSADDVVIRPEIAEPAAPSRVTTSVDAPPAGWFRRLFSGVVDVAITGSIGALCFAPALVAIVTHASLREKGAGGEPIFGILVAFCGLVAVAGVSVYFLATIAGRGATLGQRIFGLCVVTEDGQVPRSGAVLARMLGMLLYVGTAGLLFLGAAFDRRGLGIADRISGTRVERSSSPVISSSVPGS